MGRLALVIVLAAVAASGQQWEPGPGPLMTRWGRRVSPADVHPEHPRPGMRRARWVSLNGLWDYAIRPKDAGRPERPDGSILVPFPVEAALSGVMKRVGAGQRLWYRRTFIAPRLDPGGHLLLHFGAVDWHATVWVNGNKAGEHRGGYDPFTLDITRCLRSPGEQELVVAVHDPTDASWQPRGKQVRDPHGIWYSPVTGIWQTVWLEPVPACFIQALRCTPDVDAGALAVSVRVRTPPGRTSLTVEVLDGGRGISRVALDVSADGPRTGRSLAVRLPVPEARLWSPDSPFLYRLRLVLHHTEGTDRVDSRFGMRKISVARDEAGVPRIHLNNRPLFLLGPLDQGWWPDGLYTAPTDAALRSDVEVMKRLGFNMVRKHVKVEPDRWYYHCDELGLLVWQDMPNGDRHIGPRSPDLKRSQESAEGFRRELRAVMDALHNHPCVVVWVPFNEGWGQFDTERILRWVGKHDPSRLVDGPSGWTDRGGGHLRDVHCYPGPAMPALEPRRAVVLGEFGGLGLPVAGHLWQKDRNWGYRTFRDRAALQAGYEELVRRLRPLHARGLAAAVYTQLTDVEGEVNGLMTYDRDVLKLDATRLARLHPPLFGTPPTLRVVTPTSEKDGLTWRFVTDDPGKGWQEPEFDDSTWRSGPGGFGAPGTPGALVRTVWKTRDIWLRRTFEVQEAASGHLHLRIRHDEDAEVWLNGRHVAALTGHVTGYTDVELPDAARALCPGSNTLAIHCHQTRGGQYVDAGLFTLIPAPR